MAASYQGRFVTGFFFATMLAVALVPGSGINQASAQRAATTTTTPDSLFVALLANGDSLVEYDVLIAQPSAKSVTVQLFGTHINDLIVTDFDDNILDFSPGQNPGEVTISPAGAKGARISYTTPDLVGKDRNVWTFMLESPIGFSVKMPSGSVVIDYGDAMPSIILVGDQTLLTFQAGAKQVKYVIGVVGTEERANITIKLVETTIKETEASYPGIVLAETKDLLAKAVAAKEAGNFAEAERMAAQANDAAKTTAREFGEAGDAVESAKAEVERAAGQGRDVTQARALLEQADAQFAAGSYSQAQNTAGRAVAAIGQAPQFPVTLAAGIGAAVAVAAAAAGALFVLRKRKRQPQAKEAYRRPAPAAVPEQADNDDDDDDNVAEPALEIPADDPPPPSSLEQQQQLQQPGEPVQEELAAKPAEIVPDSHTDRGLLGRIVARIFEEKPHLRQEDRNVLQFLAENEGAAFESEVRTKFQLPKTTVWRLVKRLEREELVEIRKAGGQNLIKLRFEGRQP